MNLKEVIIMRRKIIPKHPYYTHGHYVTKHAIFDMNKCNISKGELGYNLSKKPVYKSKPIFDLLKRLFYIRMDDKKTLTIINPSNKNVCSVRKYHNKELKKEKECLIMKQISEKTIKFLKNNVKDLNLFIPLNDDKRYDLLEHVENMFVIPLANATNNFN